MGQGRKSGKIREERLEKKAKKLVPKQFYKWIKIFRKKASERMPMRKMWDHAIDLKKEFVPRKEKEEVREFVQE